jgi:hypothetical protein
MDARLLLDIDTAYALRKLDQELNAFGKRAGAGLGG